MLEGSEIFFSVIVIGIFLCVILPLILYQRKNDYSDNYYEKELLCIPSGEIIKVSGNRWNKFTEKNLIIYDFQFRFYTIPDKYSKYKLKNRKII